jgi:hypothetical protein
MNWYLVISIIAAFLLGWAIGIWLGTQKGYAAAVQEQQEQMLQETWSRYFNQFKGGKNEQEE